MLLTFLCVKAEILRHLYRFISTFLTKAACCRNIEIVQYPTNLKNIYIYIHDVYSHSSGKHAKFF